MITRGVLSAGSDRETSTREDLHSSQDGSKAKESPVFVDRPNGEGSASPSGRR